MHIAICDDCPADGGHLASLIGEAHSVRLFFSAEALLARQEPFDLYLLDIFLSPGDLTGIDLGRAIRARDPDALICFISSSRACYEEAFALYAFQYLVKPVDPEAFRELLRRAARQADRSRFRERSVQLSWRGRSVSVPCSRILFISSQGHTLSVFCKDGIVEQHVGQLSQLEPLLDSRVFARCHQSYLVNLYNISSLSGSEFTCGGQRVPISRRYADVKERYRKLLFEDME